MHFRTADLHGDMLDLLGYASSRGLHSKPESALRTLVTQEMTYKLSDQNSTLISIGTLLIFPSLTNFVSTSPGWARLEALVKALGQISGLAVLAEAWMGVLNEVRRLTETGVSAAYSTVSSPLSFGLTAECGSVYPFIDVRPGRTKQRGSFGGRSQWYLEWLADDRWRLQVRRGAW